MREIFKIILKRFWSLVTEPVILTIFISLVVYGFMTLINHQESYLDFLYLCVNWFLDVIEGILEIIFRNLGFWISLILLCIFLGLISRTIKHKSTTLLIFVICFYSLSYWSHKQKDLFLSCDGTMYFRRMLNEKEISSYSEDGTMKFSFTDYPERYSWSRDEFFLLPVKEVFLFGKYSFPNICQNFDDSFVNCTNSIPEKRFIGKYYTNEVSNYQTTLDRRTGFIVDSETKKSMDSNQNKISSSRIFKGLCSEISDKK